MSWEEGMHTQYTNKIYTGESKKPEWRQQQPRGVRGQTGKAGEYMVTMRAKEWALGRNVEMADNRLRQSQSARVTDRALRSAGAERPDRRQGTWKW